MSGAELSTDEYSYSLAVHPDQARARWHMLRAITRAHGLRTMALRALEPAPNSKPRWTFLAREIDHPSPDVLDELEVSEASELPDWATEVRVTCWFAVVPAGSREIGGPGSLISGDITVDEDSKQV